jgi:hypothetical protein
MKSTAFFDADERQRAQVALDALAKAKSPRKPK